MARKKKRSRRAGRGSAFERNGSWVIQYTVQGQRRRKRLGPVGREAAERALADVQLRIARGEALGELEPERVTLAEFWAAARSERKQRLRPQAFRAFAGHMRRAITHFGDRALCDATTADVRGFLTSLTQPDRSEDAKDGDRIAVSPATRNRYARSLSIVFGLAVERGCARANPVAQLKPEKEPQLPREYLAPQDISRLLECIGERFRDALRFAVDAGLRQGELLALAWRDVDFSAGAHGAVTVRESKSGRPRTVPLTAEASAILKRRKSERTPGPRAELVFGCQWRTGGSLYRAIRRAARKAGARFASLRWHDLRHGFASALARAGVPIPQIGALLGHAPSSMSTTLRYSVHAPEGAAFNAVAALELSREREAAEAAEAGR